MPWEPPPYQDYLTEEMALRSKSDLPQHWLNYEDFVVIIPEKVWAVWRVTGLPHATMSTKK